MAKRKKKRGPGRPRVKLDLAIIERLAARGNGAEVIGEILDVDRRTLERRPDFSRALKRGAARANLKLCNLQWKLATRLNPAMLIFLGKNRLGQRDRPLDEAPLDREVRVFVDQGWPSKSESSITPAPASGDSTPPAPGSSASLVQ